jgi:hypothetical protein
MVRSDDSACHSVVLRLSDSKGQNTMVERTDTASYIAEITVGLTRMARKDELGLLAYILEMATLEALRCRDNIQCEPVNLAS